MSNTYLQQSNNNMADTALDEEEIKEFYDTPDELETKVGHFYTF